MNKTDSATFLCFAPPSPIKAQPPQRARRPTRAAGRTAAAGARRPAHSPAARRQSGVVLCHVQGLVAQQLAYGVDGQILVDELGGKGMAQLMRRYLDAALLPRVHALDDFHRPRQVGLGQIGAGGQAEAVPKERLGHDAAHGFTTGKDRLQVHGLPDRARFDVRRFQRQTDGLAIRAELRRVYRDDREPTGVTAPSRLGHEADAGQVAEGLLVKVKVAPPRLHPFFQHLQLPAPDPGQHIAHAVVVTDLRVLVMGRGIPGLSSELAGVGDEAGVVGDQHAAAGGGDDLVAVEGEDARFAEGSWRPSVIGGAQCLGGIFDHWNLIPAADRQDRSQVGALAVEVDRYDRLRQLALARLAFDRLRQQRRVDVPGAALTVDEDRSPAQIGDGVDAGGEGERGDEHLVARADAGQEQRQVQRGRARAERRGMAAADRRSELVFKGVDMRAERRDPVGGEGVLDVLLLQAGHVGRGEVDAVQRPSWIRCKNAAWAADGMKTTPSINSAFLM